MKKQLKSFKSAFHGLAFVLVNEGHMRFHAAAAATAILLGFLCGLSAVKMAVLAVLCALVTALEAVNTCIELLCEICSEGYSPAVKLVKDIAAAAVLISAIAAVFVGTLLFVDFAVFEAALQFVQNPMCVVLSVLWLALCVLFVFPGPVKIKKKISAILRR